MSKSFEEENEKRYGLEGYTSDLTFREGKMISRGGLNGVTVEIDLRYCKGCGICTEECPTGALHLEKERGPLQEAIHASFPDRGTSRVPFDPDHPLTWQELPHHGGLIVASGRDSYNWTSSWRIGEVVIANADRCVVCGLCYQHCPEDIIRVIPSDSHEEGKAP